MSKRHRPPGAQRRDRHQGHREHCGKRGCNGFPPPPDETYERLVIELLLCAVDAKAERCTEILQHVSDTRGAHGIFEVCCALASSVVTMAELQPVHAAGELLAIAREPGYELGPGDEARLPDDERYSLRAGRFVAAYGNRDFPACEALFWGVNGEDEAMGWVIELLGMAGSVGRHKQAEVRRKRQRDDPNGSPPGNG